MKNLISIYFFSVALNVFSQSSGTFIDNRDNQSYKWVKIGNQIWMAENLNFNTGRGSGKYGNIYGRVYNWETAKKVCPSGWHLPSDIEWKELEAYIGMNSDELNNRNRYDRESGKVGFKLKSKSGWKLYMGKSNGIDAYDFNALPGGFYQTYNKRFMYYGSSIYFWTSTPVDGENALIRGLDSSSDGISRDDLYKVHGAYCRCIKD